MKNKKNRRTIMNFLGIVPVDDSGEEKATLDAFIEAAEAAEAIENEIAENTEEVAEDKAIEDAEEVAEDKATEDVEEVAEDKATEDVEEVAEDKATEDVEEVAEDKATEDVEEVIKDEVTESTEAVAEDETAVTDYEEAEASGRVTDDKNDLEKMPEDDSDMEAVRQIAKGELTANEKRLSYTVLLVPNHAHKVHQFKVYFDTIILLTILAAACIVGGVFYITTLNGKLRNIEGQVNTAYNQAATVQNDNTLLQAQLEEVQSALRDAKISLEAAKTYRQHEVEKQSEQSTPVILPVGNMASMPTEYSEDHPYVEFTTGYGTKIIATADGVVSSVMHDDKWGFVVRLDHGNGYETAYMVNVEPQVSEGDKVTRQNTLFTVDDDGLMMAYQILFNGKAINPTSVIQIDG